MPKPEFADRFIRDDDNPDSQHLVNVAVTSDDDGADAKVYVSVHVFGRSSSAFAAVTLGATAALDLAAALAAAAEVL